MGDPVFVVFPTGSQQQQPLQSVQSFGFAVLGWHTASQAAELPPPVPDALPPLPAAAPPAPADVEPPVPEEVAPPVPADVEPPDDPVPPPVPAVLAPPLSSLPHPTSPTVEEAPVTTKTWKSRSIFMGGAYNGFSRWATRRLQSRSVVKPDERDRIWLPDPSRSMLNFS